MAKRLEVVFSAHSPQFNAKPGDTKTVTEEEAGLLAADGVAAPRTKSAAKQAGLDPEAAASVKK